LNLKDEDLLLTRSLNHFSS